MTDNLPPEYFGCSALDDPACPVMPYLTRLEIETEYFAVEELADCYYQYLAN